MSIYDNVGASYDEMRSNVGANVIRDDVKRLGSEIKIIDLGCGTGHPIAKAVSPLVKRYYGIDNSQPMLDAYLENVQDADCKLLNMQDIDQISGHWDFIFSWGAICHLPIEFQKKTMTAASKLLRPGGQFLFTSGEHADECTGTVGKYTVYHYSMGRSAYTEFLNAQGMELINASYTEGEFYLYRFKKNT